MRRLIGSLFEARQKKMAWIKRAIQTQGLVVPLNAENAVEHAEAAIAAGAEVLEVYLRASSGETCSTDILSALVAMQEVKKRFPNAFIGAGSADQPELAVLAIESGADFVISQGFVPDTAKLCAAHGVLCILGASDCASISQYVQLMQLHYQCDLSDEQLSAIGVTRAQAEMLIVKFFNATDRMKEFDGIATTYVGREIFFLIAGGVTVVPPTYNIDVGTLQTDQSIASWSSRKIVCAVTSSAMMKGNVQVGVKAALDQVQFGRTTPPAKKG